MSKTEEKLVITATSTSVSNKSARNTKNMCLHPTSGTTTTQVRKTSTEAVLPVATETTIPKNTYRVEETTSLRQPSEEITPKTEETTSKRIENTSNTTQEESC